jgi:hypothetical protein
VTSSRAAIAAPVVSVPPEIAERPRRPIERMVAIG